jgi:hypothetical protein
MLRNLNCGAATALKLFSTTITFFILTIIPSPGPCSEELQGIDTKGPRVATGLSFHGVVTEPVDKSKPRVLDFDQFYRISDPSVAADSLYAYAVGNGLNLDSIPGVPAGYMQKSSAFQIGLPYPAITPSVSDSAFLLKMDGVVSENSNALLPNHLANV